MHFCIWLAQVDSNHRPRAYQARALTTWAMRHCGYAMYLVLSRRFVFPFFLTRFSEKWRVKSEEVKFASRISGGDEGNRTLDPLLAGQVLSQLSYTPIKWGLLSFLYGHSKLNNNERRTRLSAVLHLRRLYFGLVYFRNTTRQQLCCYVSCSP